MAYVRIENNIVAEFPYSVLKLRRDNPSVSFPSECPTSLLADFGVYEVAYSAQPSFDDNTQTLELNSSPTLVNGVWTVEHTVSTMSSEQASDYTERRATDEREARDVLLSKTDWWATSDRTMTAEQTAYRQALRDITDQVGFPTDITWPTKPE